MWGMAALYLFGFQLQWFPLGHAYSDQRTPSFTPGFVWDVVRHAAHHRARGFGNARFDAIGVGYPEPRRDTFDRSHG